MTNARRGTSTDPRAFPVGAPGPAPTELPSPRARILVADDEAPIREMLCHFLTHEGYVVSSVETGHDALAAVETFRPDVILVDMVMPGLSGADVLIALRQTRVTVPVILMSAYDVVVGDAFFTVLAKPFDLPAMADAVAAAAARGRTADD